jgi:cytochrome P450
MTQTNSAPRIDDPAWYVEQDPYPILADLRRNDPVCYLPHLDTFLITRYADIRHIGRTPEIYSSAQGMLLNDVKYGNVANSFFPEGAELVTTTDPPRHRELRRVIAPTFAGPAIDRLETVIRDKSRALIATIEPGVEFDFVEKIAVRLPVQVICALLGVDDSSVADISRWSDDMTRMGDDLTREELADIVASLGPFNDFLMAQIAAKRGNRGVDLLSTLLQAEIDNEKLTDLNVFMLTSATLVAGNETTRHLLGQAVYVLAQHPDERARLVADPGLSGTAVDETLRFVSPVAGFLRTAVSDTELSGTTIKAGQHVYMLYMSGNHDETVFSDPERYDVGRVQQPSHVAFGFGEHVCPGASLARLEVKVFLEELIARFPSWDITGPAIPIMSVLMNGYTHLPVIFHSDQSPR